MKDHHALMLTVVLCLGVLLGLYAMHTFQTEAEHSPGGQLPPTVTPVPTPTPEPGSWREIRAAGTRDYTKPRYDWDWEGEQIIEDELRTIAVQLARVAEALEKQESQARPDTIPLVLDDWVIVDPDRFAVMRAVMAREAKEVDDED